jgi:hypothetical protein
MSQQVIDLSVPPENGVAADPSGYEMSIENMGHNGIIDQWVRRYKGLNPAMLPNAEAVALERSGSRPATPRRYQYGSRMRKLPTGRACGCSAGRARWLSANF